MWYSVLQDEKFSFRLTALFSSHAISFAFDFSINGLYRYPKAAGMR